MQDSDNLGQYWQGPPDDNWYLYKAMNGRVRLIHRWHDDYGNGSIKYPYCGKPLYFKKYKAWCDNCKLYFGSGWGSVQMLNRYEGDLKPLKAGWEGIVKFET